MINGTIRKLQKVADRHWSDTAGRHGPPRVTQGLLVLPEYNRDVAQAQQNEYSTLKQRCQCAEAERA